MIDNVTYETVEQENYDKLVNGKNEFIYELLSRLDEKSKRMIDEKKLIQNIDCIRQDMCSLTFPIFSSAHGNLAL